MNPGPGKLANSGALNAETPEAVKSCDGWKAANPTDH